MEPGRRQRPEASLPQIGPFSPDGPEPRGHRSPSHGIGGLRRTVYPPPDGAHFDCRKWWTFRRLDRLRSRVCVPAGVGQVLEAAFAKTLQSCRVAPCRRAKTAWLSKAASAGSARFAKWCRPRCAPWDLPDKTTRAGRVLCDFVTNLNAEKHPDHGPQVPPQGLTYSRRLSGRHAGRTRQRPPGRPNKPYRLAAELRRLRRSRPRHHSLLSTALRRNDDRLSLG
jgi:hypothetical protein